MKASRVLIKLGGASLEDQSVFEEIAKALKQYLKYDYQVALVHGGGPAINAELVRRGIKWEFVGGQRVTTPEMMDVIEMVLSGSVNRKLVRHFNSRGLPAMGISGVDRGTLLCRPAAPELGLVGLVEKVEAKWLEDFVRPGQTTIPVIAPLGGGISGETYNVNADMAASALAGALGAQYLIFLTDQNGILDRDGRPLRFASAADLRRCLEDGTVTGGMATKVRAILQALDSGVSAVRVLHAKSAVDGLWSNDVGTWCASEKHPFESRTDFEDAADLAAYKEFSDRRGTEFARAL